MPPLHIVAFLLLRGVITVNSATVHHDSYMTVVLWRIYYLNIKYILQQCSIRFQIWSIIILVLVLVLYILSKSK